jgi:hypothetical protein
VKGGNTLPVTGTPYGSALRTNSSGTFYARAVSPAFSCLSKGQATYPFLALIHEQFSPPPLPNLANHQPLEGLSGKTSLYRDTRELPVSPWQPGPGRGIRQKVSRVAKEKTGGSRYEREAGNAGGEQYRNSREQEQDSNGFQRQPAVADAPVPCVSRWFQDVREERAGCDSDYPRQYEFCGNGVKENSDLVVCQKYYGTNDEMRLPVHGWSASCTGRHLEPGAGRVKVLPGIAVFGRESSILPSADYLPW